MFNRAKLHGLALASVLTFSSVASSQQIQQTYTRISMDQIEGVLKAKGIQYSRRDNTSFNINLLDKKVLLIGFDCNPQGCASMQIAAGFVFGKKPGLEKVNQWNRETRYARVYADRDGDLFLEYDVDFEGGVSIGAVSEALDTYRALLSKFLSFFGF